MTDWYVMRMRKHGFVDLRLTSEDDSYVDGWIDLCWPEAPDDQVALESPCGAEWAVVIPDGRILVFDDVDEMWKGWEEMLRYAK